MGIRNGVILLFQLWEELDHPILLSHLLDHVEEIEKLLDADAELVVVQLGHDSWDVVRAEGARLLQNGLWEKINERLSKFLLLIGLIGVSTWGGWVKIIHRIDLDQKIHQCSLKIVAELLCRPIEIVVNT